MNDKAVVMTIDAVRTRAGTNEAIVSLAIPLENAGMVAGLMGKIGRQVAVAMADVNTAQKIEPAKPKHQYGFEARALRLSSFFNNPRVREVLGGDKAFLEWIRQQSCAVKEFGVCGGDIVAMHVRRVANGSGTGIKPEFSAIPGCHNHHTLQHQKGESAVGGREYWDKLQRRYLDDWLWHAIKKNMGVESMGDVSPLSMRLWCDDNGISVATLPADYK